MKIRNGFVSNSSSSSFVCDVCGEEHSGMDISLSECEMFQCLNGHTICDSHMIGTADKTLKEKYDAIVAYNADNAERDEELDTAFKDNNEEYINDSYDNMDSDNDRYETSIEHCPICQFKNVDTSDVYQYYCKKDGLTEKQMAKKFKDEFGTYANLKKFLK